MRGAAVIERYFGEERSATDADGWFPTGDLARIDAAGNLIITGRAKDLIKSGGEWINPAEIEAVVGALARGGARRGDRPRRSQMGRAPDSAGRDARRSARSATRRCSAPLRGKVALVVDPRRGHPRAAHAAGANG